MPDPAVRKHLPLHPRVLMLLSALLDGPLHGGALPARVTDLSEGAVRLGPATLYRTLDRLVADGLLQELPAAADGTPGRPGTPYEVTALGRAVLTAEFARLEALGRALQVER